MQEASVPRYRRFVLGLHSPREVSLLLRRVFFLRPVNLLKSGATPLELFALLLFAFPLLFTLQKLLELLALGDRSHQFIAEPGNTLQQYTHITYFTLSFLIRLERSSFSLIISCPILSTLFSILLEASAGGSVFPSLFVNAP